MKVQAKRAGATLPRLVCQSDLRELGFDGYSFTLHAFDGSGREVRVVLERHEATRIAEHINKAINIQRRAIAELQSITAALGGEQPGAPSR